MSTHHSFDIDHAQLYGLREAVLISNLHYWVSYNYANDTHLHDGRTWTYNSIKAFEDLFPYLTYKQIRTSLETLITLDVLVRGNYNKNPGDRTSWFAFTDEFLNINPLPPRAKGPQKKEKRLPPRANGLPPRANGDAQEGKSLIEPDVTQFETTGESAEALGISLPLFLDYMKIRESKNAGPLTQTAITGLQDDAGLSGITVEQAVTACVKNSWTAFVPAWYAERTGATPKAAPAARKGKAQPGEQNYTGEISAIWHESISGVASRAAEMGLKPQDMVMESAPAFKARVMVAHKGGTA